jgi:hypothetical protein
MTQPTQVRRPWRTVVRSVFQGLVGAAAIAPFVYQAAAGEDPARATGLLGLALGIAAGLTRVMALPAVNAFLAKYVPFLAAEPKPAPPVTYGSKSDATYHGG